jgi:hypothetical protein
VVLSEGFDFHEEIGGIVTPTGIHARRLVGWGSLNPLEACATRWWAAVQVRRSAADTRLAIHPADMARPRTITSIRRALKSLLARSAPENYRTFLQTSSPSFPGT